MAAMAALIAAGSAQTYTTTTTTTDYVSGPTTVTYHGSGNPNSLTDPLTGSKAYAAAGLQGLGASGWIPAISGNYPVATLASATAMVQSNDWMVTAAKDAFYTPSDLNLNLHGGFMLDALQNNSNAMIGLQVTQYGSNTVMFNDLLEIEPNWLGGNNFSYEALDLALYEPSLTFLGQTIKKGFSSFASQFDSVSGSYGMMSGSGINLSTNSFNLYAGRYNVSLELFVQAGETGDANAKPVSTNFSDTLTFAKNGPVLGMDKGWNVNSAQCDIVGNAFNAVPEPSAFAALGIGCVALLRRKQKE